MEMVLAVDMYLKSEESFGPNHIAQDGGKSMKQ